MRLRLRAGAAAALAVCWGSLVPGLGAQEPLSWADMQAEIRRRPPTAATRVAYGPGPDRFGELRLPPGPGPHPVAVVVHGGCWLSIADLSYMRPVASELNRLGWATWTLEFNRIDEPEGRWPGILDDVARGADELRRLADLHPLDLDRVVAVGHSSGGHLALWLAARSGALSDSSTLPGSGEAPLRLHGVVGLAPVAGLEDFQARSDRCGSTIVADLLGLGGADPGGGADGASRRREARLATTDPERLLPLDPPQLLLYGAEDAIVPPAHGLAWERKVRATGGAVEIRVVPGAGHFELVAPWTAPWAAVEDALGSFLGRTGVGG